MTGRLVVIVVALSGSLGACSVSRTVRAPTVLPTDSEATLADLVALVNERSAVESLTARADLQFETSEKDQEGVMRRYRAAQGRLILLRPSHIRLQIEAPLLGVSIAEMASDGRRFQLLIYPQEYRALIEGSNQGEYRDQAKKIESDPKLKQAGPLVNIRPQHFTEAFLFEPIDLDDPTYVPVRQEIREVEEDDRPRATKDQRVKRSYYMLSDIRRGESAPRRTYWFDRTRGLRLSRLQKFDTHGLLIGDVSFRGSLPVDAATGLRFPAEVYIVRTYEQYALRISLKPGSLSANREIPPQAFSLQPPAEWGDTLRRVDLDEKAHLNR